MVLLQLNRLLTVALERVVEVEIILLEETTAKVVEELIIIVNINNNDLKPWVMLFVCGPQMKFETKVDEEFPTKG